MPTFTYPEARELRVLRQELEAIDRGNRLAFDIMPIRNSNAAVIEWSQRDNYKGLQNLRGLDGSPVHVQMVGDKRFISQPGSYGDFATITETELTLRAGSVTGEVNVDISELVAERERQLVVREDNRLEKIVWDLLVTGTFSVAGKNGTITHTDTFNVQTYSRIVAWSSASTAVPLADLRAVQQLGSGKGVNFGAGSMAIMNRVTANQLLNNTNTSDLHGRWSNSNTAIQNATNTNQILTAEDLPTIRVYDEGYVNDAGAYTKWIPDGKVLIVGARSTGENLGEYRMTRNLVNPGAMPGSYGFVKDYAAGINAPKEVPPKIEVHRGHNGGPVLYYPSAIVVMTIN